MRHPYGSFIAVLRSAVVDAGNEKCEHGHHLPGVRDVQQRIPAGAHLLTAGLLHLLQLGEFGIVRVQDPAVRRAWLASAADPALDRPVAQG
ncbi:hypothetical protein AAW14_34975 [Streptomyces hygroscopicus]|nr:hypothetical protein [Streptomyces hygroscopicus]